MQCVIIAAGKGTRMRPLTDELAKPLIPICGKPLINHIVESLPSEIDELVLVVGNRADQIREHCGDTFLDLPVTYVTQKNFAGGTGDALMCAKDVLKKKFLFMYADDIHGRVALAKVVKEDNAILAIRTDQPQHFGILALRADGTLAGMVEKPEPGTEPSDWANISGWVVSSDILNYNITLSPRGELEATDMLTAYAQDHPVKIIEQDLWLPIGYPENIPAAENILCPAE